MINLVEMRFTLAEAQALWRILQIALNPKTGALPHLSLEDQSYGGSINARLNMLTEEACYAKVRGLHATVTHIVEGMPRTDKLGATAQVGEEEEGW